MTEPTATQLMAMTAGDARRLFPGDAAAIAARFRALARVWHPDRNRDSVATAVFAHIVALHGVAIRAAADGRIERRFRTRQGRSFRLRCRAQHEGDFGEILVGDRHVAHVVPAVLDDLALVADAFRPRFADARMQTAVAPYLPRRLATLETATGRVFVEHKRPDQLLMRDLMRLGPVDPRHAAWMATRLLNIACWLGWAGIAHGAIGPDTLLVSPEMHGVALTGPMLCAGGFGTAPAALPERTLDSAPRYAAAFAEFDRRLDPELVKLTLRELLGDPAGTRLAADPHFPRPFAHWLLMPTAGNARADFIAWEAARDASFGPPRFVRWDVDPAAVMAA